MFTTHTPVPAGIDRFPVEMVRALLRRRSAEDPSGASPRLLPGVPMDRIVAFGAEDDPTKFNMAHMGLRLAQRANGVSLLHGRVSRAMFNELWPGFDPAEVPIGSITNGVHGPHLGGAAVAGAGPRAARQRGPRLAQRARRRGSGCSRSTPGTCGGSARSCARLLVDDVRARLRRSWLERGASDAELGWIATAFDPDVLTIGFARRVPTYKRLTLMLRDPDRLEKLLLDEKRPIQLIVAGKSHPADDGGKALIQQVVRFADRPEVRHRIAFLPDYDMSMARLLYWGCDVWLNNPLRPLEACGTSGMKSALNGGLNLSIRDGWWDEWYDGENGWEIPTADGLLRRGASRRPRGRRALRPARAVGGAEVLRPRRARRPDALGRDGAAHPAWTLGPKVLASRMVRDYTEQYYAPAAQSLRKTIEPGADGEPFGAARELAAYRQRAERGLAEDPDHRRRQLRPAGYSAARLGAHADRDRAPGRPAPDEVVVQAVVGRVDASDALVDPVTVPMAHTGTAEGGNEVFSTTTPLPVAGPVGYTVRVLPHHPLLAGDNELGLVTLA